MKYTGLNGQVKINGSKKTGPNSTVVSGLIWTNLVSIRNVIFFLKIVSYGQIRVMLIVFVYFFSGHCEFTPPNREKKTSDRAYLVLG